MNRTTGVSGMVPTPPPGSSASTGFASPCALPVSATLASPATVRCSKTSRGVKMTPRALARDTSWMETMLSPPRAKNESSTPTRWAPSTSANTSAMVCSSGVRGARNSASVSKTGSGSARRSSLPTGVSGTLSSTMIAEGTM
ncbi:hypothetical protein NWFMUON74_64180 [Nocardia wallacei]|uniref:Uncharacterized protein n=1 Tax=Nocardia wallacei TaxID=480035 RepID=A0A7G1KVQ0_9NOCA|nr:hypothetical protein NWFMUON74_64180 [Nocardia wallacei]